MRPRGDWWAWCWRTTRRCWSGTGSAGRCRSWTRSMRQRRARGGPARGGGGRAGLGAAGADRSASAGQRAGPGPEHERADAARLALRLHGLLNAVVTLGCRAADRPRPNRGLGRPGRGRKPGPGKRSSWAGSGSTAVALSPKPMTGSWPDRSGASAWPQLGRRTRSRCWWTTCGPSTCRRSGRCSGPQRRNRLAGGRAALRADAPDRPGAAGRARPSGSASRSWWAPRAGPAGPAGSRLQGPLRGERDRGDRPGRQHDRCRVVVGCRGGGRGR